MTDAKVVNTEDLKILITQADRAQYNRRIDKALVERLDPEGKHILGRVLAFMNDGDVDRVRLLAKVVGTDEPEIGYLDVKHSIYESLTGAEDFLAAARAES